MDDLVRWLGAQLDEDAARAMAAGGDGWRRQDHPSDTVAVYDSKGEPVVYDEGWPSEAQAEHIAEWDPARVLREIDAKRKVLAEYEQADRYSRTTWGQSNADQSRARTLGKVVRLLASVYSDRPGYREEWAPAV